MPRRTLEDDWDGEDSYGDDEESETIPCPYCKRQIHEDAVRCPHCENYLSQEDAPLRRKPWWIIVGVLLCFVIFYLWIRYG
jgi:hypothetical protein